MYKVHILPIKPYKQLLKSKMVNADSAEILLKLVKGLYQMEDITIIRTVPKNCISFNFEF